MPLFAILHIDFEGLHPSSCKVITASSQLEIAKNILENPSRWRAMLLHAQSDDGDPRSIWQQIQEGTLTPEGLLTLINRTSLDVDFGEMVRIYPLDIQALNDVCFTKPGNKVLHPAQDVGANLKGDFTNPLLTQLAEDARSLLVTQGFLKYIHTLLRQDIWQQSNLHTLNLITPDLSTWLLPSLEIPVKLSNIEIRENSTGSSEAKDGYSYFCSYVQFGLWSSNLKIPIAEEYEGYRGSSSTVGNRWLDVGDSLKKSIELSGFWIGPEIPPEQKPKLLIELTCLLSYSADIAELIIPKSTTATTSKNSPQAFEKYQER